MATNKFTPGTRTALTSSSLATLAAATYCVSNAYNCMTNNPWDVAVEVAVATTNTPSGGQKVDVFLKEALDDTNFRSGPESGTTTTDEADLLPIGTVFVKSSTNTHRGTFSVRQALGYVPNQFKIVTKNDLGVALTSGTIYTSEIVSTSA